MAAWTAARLACSAWARCAASAATSWTRQDRQLSYCGFQHFDLCLACAMPPGIECRHEEASDISSLIITAACGRQVVMILPG